MSHYQDAERGAWKERLNALFTEADTRFQADSANRSKAARNRFWVGIGFLVAALFCVVSLYAGLPRLLRGAASSTLQQLEEIRDTVRASEDQMRTRYELLESASSRADAAVTSLGDKQKLFTADNKDVVSLLNDIRKEFRELERNRQRNVSVQWDTLSSLVDKKADIEALQKAISTGDTPADAKNPTPAAQRPYTNAKQLETTMRSAKEAVYALYESNAQLLKFNESITQLAALAVRAKPDEPSAVERVVQAGTSADDAMVEARRALVDQLTPAFTGLAEEMKRLQNAGGRITDAADKLNEATKIGTGPVAYTVLAIAAMFATFGVSALWKWSRTHDDAAAAQDRYFAARLIALNAVMLASRDGASTDGARADTAAVLATIERAILGIRQPKEAAFPAPLPTLTTAGELIAVIRGDKK